MRRISIISILASLSIQACAQEIVLFSAGPTNGFPGRIVNCRNADDWKEWRSAHPDLLPSRLPVVLNVTARTWGDTLADVETATIKYAVPVEVPSAIFQSVATNGAADAGPAYGIVFTTNGDFVVYLDHASPRPSPAETQRRIAAAIATNNAARKKAKDEVNGQLQQRIENLERVLRLRE